MKAKKGVTLLMLALIILIMTILLTVTVTNGTEIYNDAKKTKLQAEINQIEILVDNYIKRNSGITFNPYELDISEYPDEEKLQFLGENIIDGKITLYIVDLNKIDAEEVAYGVQDKGVTDRYLYSPVTKRVYHEQGRKIGGAIYHRVDEIVVATLPWKVERTTNAEGLVIKVVVTNGIETIDVGKEIEGYKDWKILGADENGRLLILSPIIINAGTTLSGKDGYVNALTTINGACENYIDANSPAGIAVRSIMPEDVDALTNFEKSTFNIGQLNAYGNEITYAWNGGKRPIYSYEYNGTKKSGTLSIDYDTTGFTYYDEEANEWITSDYTTISKEIVTLKSEYYSYTAASYLSTETEAYKMLFGDKKYYWLASRCMSPNASAVNFGVKTVTNNGIISIAYLYSSAGQVSTGPYPTRAVVTLADNVGVKLNKSTGKVDIIQ